MGENRVSAQQKYRTKLRSKDLCADCPAPANGYRCEYHRKLNRKYGRAYHERHRQPLTWPLHTRSWVRKLLTRKSFTAVQAGEVSGLLGRDAISRMRRSPSLKLTVLGKDPNANHYRTSVYKVELKRTN